MDYSTKEDIIELIVDKIKHFIIPSENNNYRSIFLQSKFLLGFVILLFVFKITTVFVSINLPYNIFFADITKSTLESFVNQTRESVGLKPLKENEKLNQSAQLKAQNMIENNYFDHVSPSGITPWYWFKQVGYNYKYAGENLAIGFYDSQEVYQAWLNSPSHKANILNPNYTEVGTAVLNGFGGKNTIVVVQQFGSLTPIKNTNPAKTNTNNKTPIKVETKEIPVTPEVTITTNAEDSQTAQASNEKINEGKVLSEAVEIKNYIKLSSGTGIDSIPSKVMNSVLYSREEWLENIIFSTSLVVIGILLSLIFFNININLKRQLIFRAVLIMVLLSVATFINKDFILSLIPHQILI